VRSFKLYARVTASLSSSLLPKQPAGEAQKILSLVMANCCRAVVGISADCICRYRDGEVKVAAPFPGSIATAAQLNRANSVSLLTVRCRSQSSLLKVIMQSNKILLRALLGSYGRMSLGSGLLLLLVSCGGGTQVDDLQHSDVVSKTSSIIVADEVVERGAAAGPAACRVEKSGRRDEDVDNLCSYSSVEEARPEGSPQAYAEVAVPSMNNILPVPTEIANGSTVRLQCGTTYQGTLELSEKSGVTVKTVGRCGKATISPGSPITDWERYRGDIYVAPIGFVPLQVAVDGVPSALAHWPDLPNSWAEPGSTVPSDDLDGATVVYLDHRSLIKSEPLTAASPSSSERLATISRSKPFYIEGKLWMLDSPGEWAIQDQRLYLWMPDGRAPEGRVWAAPDSNGIKADHSTNVTIDGVQIFLGADGISANKSIGLHVLHSDIVNSARDGISAGGSDRMRINMTNVSNARQNGISGGFWIANSTVANSKVSNTGMVNLPTPTEAGIFLGKGENNRLYNVHVTNSSYRGIAVINNLRSAVVNSMVDTACVRLTDCGGIYTYERSREQPLDMLIESNIVTNVKGPEGIGIYLDDSANHVVVARNKVFNNTKGMMIHSGFKNTIRHNTFASSAVMHISFPQDNEGDIHGNKIFHNTFISTNGEQTYNMGPARYGKYDDLKAFAEFEYNTYVSKAPVATFARTTVCASSTDCSQKNAVNYRTFNEWKSWKGQEESHSQMNGRP